MNIEWWMIDGIVCLIILAAALRGAIRGIGDTVIRIMSLAGGAVLAFLYSGKTAEYLRGTSLNTAVHDHIYTLLRGNASDAAEAAGSAGTSEGSEALSGLLSGSDNSLAGFLSKSLTGLFSNAADKAAEAAAEKLTETAISVIAFALIILTVMIAAAILRELIRRGRKNSIMLGFTDRVLGFVLGTVRGLMLAWLAVALLMPVTAIVSPLSLAGMLSALQETTVAKVLYDVNPVLFAVRMMLRS